jgi:hypothetical protein
MIWKTFKIQWKSILSGIFRGFFYFNYLVKFRLKHILILFEILFMNVVHAALLVKHAQSHRLKFNIQKFLFYCIIVIQKRRFLNVLLLIDSLQNITLKDFIALITLNYVSYTLWLCFMSFYLKQFELQFLFKISNVNVCTNHDSKNCRSNYYQIHT